MTTRRRPKGDGSIYRTRDGRWRGSVEVVRADGSRGRKYFSGRNKSEVAKQVRAAKERVDRGLPLPDASLTLTALIDRYLAEGIDPNAAPNTRSAAAGVGRLVAKRIGGRKVIRLAPSDVSNLCSAMLEEGYSNSYAARVRTFLGQVLKFAEAEGLVARNVASLSRSSSFAPKERDRLTKSEVVALVDAARGDRLEALVVVLATLGLRPGGSTGLVWQDVDLDEGTVTIRRSLKRHSDPNTGTQVLRLGPTKTAGSVRTLALPAIARAALRRHHVAQAAERLAAGPYWRINEGLVFATEIGTPIDPADLQRTVRRVAEKAGISKRVSPYDFRHAAISVLSDAGVSGERIADVAGNDAKTALSVYRRPMGPVVDDAVGPMDALFGTD